MRPTIERCLRDLRHHARSHPLLRRRHKAHAGRLATKLAPAHAKGDIGVCRKLISCELQALDQEIASGKKKGAYYTLIARTHEALERLTHPSAQVITSTFREWLARESYARMMTGALHGPLQAKGKDGITAFREVSRQNLSRLRALVSRKGQPMADIDRSLFERITTGKWYLTHHSDNPDLLPTGRGGQAVSRLLSRVNLMKRGIAFPTENTQDIDLHNLRDDDFVFLSISPEATAKAQSRFGSHVYVAEVDADFFSRFHVFMTADDYAISDDQFWFKTETNAIPRAAGIPASDFEVVGDAYKACVYDHLFDFQDPLTRAMPHHCLMEGDVLPGIAFIVILFRRLLAGALQFPMGMPPATRKSLQKIRQALNGGTLSPEMLNALVNGIVRPIVKVPKYLISTEVSKRA